MGGQEAGEKEECGQEEGGSDAGGEFFDRARGPDDVLSYREGAG
ncbi:MAG: hypothetical protein QW379_09465 [Thermoplasmata archaeon]